MEKQIRTAQALKSLVGCVLDEAEEAISREAERRDYLSRVCAGVHLDRALNFLKIIRVNYSAYLSKEEVYELNNRYLRLNRELEESKALAGKR